jgi:hypothetical protein
MRPRPITLKAFAGELVALLLCLPLTAAPDARKGMKAKIPTLGRVVIGWQMNTDTMGVYGDYYLKRAIVAMLGLGANLPEDAVYPLNIGDADGKPLTGENQYVPHFAGRRNPARGRLLIGDVV